uniref:Conotoxin B2 superfamily protein n=1 Tax=Conus buxeus loroisii TaxID=410709 RepID=A0AA49X9V2_CONBL|nr:conotoxin precursor B2 superfamily protein [Conus buxeus loroisii]
MLRLIIATVLASACLAYPQRRDGAPADAANLQSFDPGMQAMPNMQGMQGMPGFAGGQFLPFNPNFGMGYKRDVDENLEKRRHHSKFNENKSPFDAEDGLGNFMNFMKENGNNLPFANMDSAATDLGNFEPSAQNEDGKFRFFDKQQ